MNIKTKNALEKVEAEIRSATTLSDGEFTTKMFADIHGITGEAAYKVLARMKGMSKRPIRIDGHKTIAWSI